VYPDLKALVMHLLGLLRQKLCQLCLASCCPEIMAVLTSNLIDQAKEAAVVTGVQTAYHKPWDLLTSQLKLPNCCPNTASRQVTADVP